ncbi:L7Ae/L30e/S12e/Gadd45 family ribosomal protein [Lachnoclostridium sp. Marseille-P6806]|uniref:L7Ae/L30e/S12e/Gadd45 family ribosomal protein n=1 Tax=Lachnoclostridium sp. Marseille-P6806 TaxID=2364793 RepID=UPI00103073E8|nr:ribosomal L7Ae/L30e/S12e/Gadd45 family protein [Lachnoclostridium sp. Marseille-P6806]
MQDRVLGFLGIAEKAGRIAAGNFAADEAVKAGRAALVIVAEDAQKNTAKGFRDACAFYHVPLRSYGTRDALGRSVGKKDRTVLAVLDGGFANRLIHMLDACGGEEARGRDRETPEEGSAEQRKNKRGCNGENENQ